MSGQQPPSWFTDQEQPPNDPDFERRKQQLLEELPTLLERQRGKGRAQSFLPYLLIRSVLGDRGDRPLSTPFWESPDIWTAEGDPATAPAIPADHGGTVTAGAPATVYAHVWNLGFAPLAGVVVEFYWFDPSLGIDGTDAHLIGTARCELAARGMQGSHALVKCPKPWVPVVENGGHECLVVRASGIGDPLGANEWQPWKNRHVAQRNVSVVGAQQSVAQLIESLGAMRGIHRVQLVQLGAREGHVAARIVAPGAKVSPRVATHLLAELQVATGHVVLEHPAQAPAAMLAPVHALAAGGAPAPPPLRRPGEVPVVDPVMVLHDPPQQDAEATGSGHVAALLASAERLHPGAERLGRPGPGEVHVLRLAGYDGEGQLAGGYTLVVPGP